MNQVYKSGDLVKFKRDDGQGGAGVVAGEIGIVLQNALLTGRYLVRVGNPAEINDRLIHVDEIEKRSRLYRSNIGITDAFAWWSLHWQEHEPETRVLFRVWNDGGGVIALFPDDAANHNPTFCSSYAHIGQHGAADPYGVMNNSRRATPEEYAALKKELESAPYFYRLKIMQRTPNNSYDKRWRAIQRLYPAATVNQLTGGV